MMVLYSDGRSEGGSYKPH